MSVHRIRLRRPWQCEPAAGGACWRRTFHRPTGLGPQRRVWMVIEPVAGTGSVSLNGCPLGPLSGGHAASRFDVSDRLLPRNEMAIVLQTEPPAETSRGKPPGGVFLEIEGIAGEG